MAVKPPTRDDMVQQIITYATRLTEQLDKLLGSSDEDLPEVIEYVANNLAMRLQGGDRHVAVALRELMGHDPVEPDEILTDFWRTPVGYYVARFAGYPERYVPRRHAAAMLGVTRQRISQLEDMGALEGVREGIIDESLMRRLTGGNGAQDIDET